MHTRLFLAALLPLLISACSSDTNSPSAPEKKTGTVFQGQIDSLNKAKKVEDTLLKADKDRRKAIDDASTAN